MQISRGRTCSAERDVDDSSIDKEDLPEGTDEKHLRAVTVHPGAVGDTTITVDDVDLASNVINVGDIFWKDKKILKTQPHEIAG